MVVEPRPLVETDELETADGETMPRVVCGSFSITGFPFGFDANCTNATIVSGAIAASA